MFYLLRSVWVVEVGVILLWLLMNEKMCLGVRYGVLGGFNSGVNLWSVVLV